MKLISDGILLRTKGNCATTFGIGTPTWSSSRVPVSPINYGLQRHRLVTAAQLLLQHGGGVIVSGRGVMAAGTVPPLLVERILVLDQSAIRRQTPPPSLRRFCWTRPMAGLVEATSIRSRRAATRVSNHVQSSLASG
jgi:hypothetical protein